MARSHGVTPDSQQFRVVVTYKKNLGKNPAYDWKTAELTGESPYVYSSTETETKYYGPYAMEGVAKSQLKMHVQDGYGNPYEAVISGHYERANIVWEMAGGLS